MAYATVTQLRQYLPDIPAGTDDDSLLEAILERATGIVEAELGFRFAPYELTPETRDVNSGIGGRWLYLPAHEAESVAGVELVAGRGTAGESTVPALGYVAGSRYRLYLDSGWLPRRWYRVTAVWGYGLAPAEVVEVTLEVAVNIWLGRNALAWSGQVGAADGGARPMVRALTWAQKSIIERVRGQYPAEGAA